MFKFFAPHPASGAGQGAWRKSRPERGTVVNDLSSRFRQYSTHPTRRIIVDSCSDITRALAEELGVDLIQFPFVMEDGEHLDDQFESISAAEFYGRMRKGERVLTSSVPHGHFVEVFEVCAAAGIPTLYLSFTAGLSRSIIDAQRAAEQVVEAHPGFDLAVIDNCQPSLSATLLAEGAARMRDEGLSMRELAAWCDRVKPCIHGYFTLESLDWLVAGGRVPKAAATITAVLDMKANLAYDLDGALTLTGVSRGRKKAIKTILKQFKENYEGDAAHPIAIVDADCPADGDAIEQMVRDELGDDCPRIIRLTLDPTIGAHVGPGMVALSFWGTDRTSSTKRGKR